MVNVGYHSAKIQGQLIRSLYTKSLNQIVKFPIQHQRQVDIDIYAFSCERDLAIQVANIRSFLRFVGIPAKFVVISDGTYTTKSIHTLQQIHNCVQVFDWQELLTNYVHPIIRKFAVNSPQKAIMAFWKRLAVLTSMSIDKPTIYTDADILFFPGAETIIKLCQSDESHAWYLPDCLPSLDARLLLNHEKELHPVNAGFFLLQQQIDWQEALDRVEQVIDVPEYFTEQTVVHLAMHKAQAKPLNSEKFVLHVNDQFRYQDNCNYQQVALRHYVSDIRHKFWLNLV
ncbi:hypothetical protein B6N60_02284 [Richelia sinica FACHB-800]|uniref:Uncharacterized protein n=1 Tax=Richelia sinica FACHB-800 TaxID=1357546 RepID=A0A975Y4W4_9NOST|nr:hypothetical protein [Richelia sinica]MBD2665779.1 hypothetical protein [Richelia sinica FACHB-800]QXE23594.1 hypothetical protein B6N60_02284 [Richelia sinica FACHB-800]